MSFRFLLVVEEDWRSHYPHKKSQCEQLSTDNNMTDFLKSIVYFNKAAKWLSKNATAIGGISLGTKMYNQNE